MGRDENGDVINASKMLHSRFNRIMAIAVWAFAAVIVGLSAASTDVTLAWLYPAAALAVYLAWAAFWRPGIAVDASGVDIQNVTHRVHIPWSALIHVDTKHALTLFTPGRRFVAWSAPAPGAVAAQAISKRPLNREAQSVGSALRPGDLLGSDSGDAAMLVRDEWQRQLAGGGIEPGVANDVVISRRIDVIMIGVSSVLAALTVILLAATA